MKLKMTTLTPLWTGGVKSGEMTRIQETGIIGSLRWWYEALVRGLGGSACDPTSHTSCLYDKDKPNNGLCHACLVFGATGWRRRFRLTVEDDTMATAKIAKTMKADRSYKKQGKTCTPTWYLPNPPRERTFTINIQPLDPNFQPEQLASVIQLMANWAAIGARPQMGFGVIKLEQPDVALDQLSQLTFSHSSQSQHSNLPSLKNMFFARLKMPKATDRDTFNLKYDLRQLFGGQDEKTRRDNEKIRHFVMGTVQGERIAAKICLSRPYDDDQDGKLIRVWGWLPEKVQASNQSWSRETILDTVKSHLKDKYTLDVWREFKSHRDTVAQESDIQVYLNKLLEG